MKMKFELGDTVFFMCENKIREASVIGRRKTDTLSSRIDTKGWFVNNSEEYEVSYYGTKLKAENLFATREELIKSLLTKHR